MVIDKDTGTLQTVKTMLGDCYHIVTASSLTEAMRLVRIEKTDVILIDYELLGNNIGQLDAIRITEKGNKIPVIFCQV